MGLDMYLNLERGSRKSIDDLDNATATSLNRFDVDSVWVKESFEIGYWRKANAILGLIERTCCEDGIENCKPVYLSMGQVEEMLETCKKVQKDHSLASKLIPTQEGFFFGTQEYGEWYFEDLDYTIGLFEKLVKFLGEENNQAVYDIVFKAWW